MVHRHRLTYDNRDGRCSVCREAGCSRDCCVRGLCGLPYCQFSCRGWRSKAAAACSPRFCCAAPTQPLALPTPLNRSLRKRRCNLGCSKSRRHLRMARPRPGGKARVPSSVRPPAGSASAGHPDSSPPVRCRLRLLRGPAAGASVSTRWYALPRTPSMLLPWTEATRAR